MRRETRTFIAIGILFAALACNFPWPTGTTATPAPVCTPPACEDDELLICPEGAECPDGCGVACVTPTPIDTPDDAADGNADAADGAATDTPTLMCTPPACEGDEVVICPDTCPGGCGSVCASPTPPPATEPSIPSPTPTPASLEIVNFSADRTTLVEGEQIEVTWEAKGATDASLIWPGDGGTMEGLGEIDPTGGTATIEPYGSPVILEVGNALGTAQAEIALDIQCAHAWVPELAGAMGERCPDAAQTTWAAQQPFQNGFMIWLESNQTIYVFYESGDPQTYASYPDTFEEGDPERDPGLTPPSGLLQPIRGFGKVWREQPEVRSKLGWATASESGFETWQQRYQGFGMHNVTIWMEGVDGTVYELAPMGQTWRVFAAP